MSEHAPPETDAAERRRLESLWRLEVLDTPPDHEIDDIADLIARLLGATYAAVTFVDEDRAWSQAVRGRDEPMDVPREVSPASLAVDRRESVLEVDLDTTEDLDALALARHPLLDTDPPLRHVVAAVLYSPDGQPIGALEAAWAEDRHLEGRARRMLQRATRHVARLLELRGEADEYRRFVELSPDAVTVLDLEGRIEMANPALAQLLEVDDPRELVGRTFLDLVAAGDRRRAATELARVLFDRAGTAKLDLGLVCEDGRTVLCSVVAGHLRGSRRSLQLAIRDLDERIRGEEERARLSEQLAQAQRLDLAGQLANGLAHDLKNLLMIMHSNLDLATDSLRGLEVGDGELQAVHEDLDQVRTAVDRAGQLTAKLVQFARREPSGQAAVSLSEALEAVERLVGASLPSNVALSVQLEADLPPVAADAVGLEQVLVNLVMNAVDALPDGGTITVRAVHIAADEFTLTGADQEMDSHVYLEVHDDGVGMSEETRSRAFEPLYTTKGAARGSGLGLPTVLAFAQELGGAVDLTSRPGEGTTVTLLLPSASLAAAPSEAAERVDPGDGCHILLVDPGEQARRVITRMLEGAGYQVTPVASAEEAVEALRSEGADVLVTELSLPGMSGWRLLERLRAEQSCLKALVFGATDVGVDVEGVSTLVKPFSHDRLLRALEELLQPVV